MYCDAHCVAPQASQRDDYAETCGTVDATSNRS